MDVELRNKFKKRIEEGKIYQIQKISIQPAKEFRPVRHDYIIYFRRDTTVRPITENDLRIPKYKFDFVDFSELSSKSGVKTYTTNVIGKLKSLTPIELITLRDKTVIDKRNISLENESGLTMDLVLWDTAAHLISLNMVESLPTPVIIIAASTVVKKILGKDQLNSTRATQLHINLDIPEAQVLKNSVTKWAKIDFKPSNREAHLSNQITSNSLLTVSDTINALKATSSKFWFFCTLKNLLLFSHTLNTLNM